MYKRTIVINSLGDITEEIEKETTEEYRQLAEESKVLTEIFKDLSFITSQGYDSLEDIQYSTENTISNTDLGNKHIIQAAKIKKKTNKKILIFSSLGGATLGGIIGGGLGSVLNVPGMTLGSHIGVVLGSLLSGSIVGSGAGLIGGLTFT